MILEAYYSRTVVEIVGNVSVSLFCYNLRAAEVVVSFNTVYRLTGSYSLIVIGKRKRLVPVGRTYKLSAFPSEVALVVVS